MIHFKPTLPTILTLTRLILSPFLLPLLFFHGLPYKSFFVNICLAAVFGMLALTDFLDGHYARKLGQESAFGKILDPIADKFLLYSSLIGLLIAGRIHYFWVVLLIGREFFIMGLRNLALQNKFSLLVSGYGKLKTVAASLLIIFLIVDPAFFVQSYQGVCMVIHMLLLAVTVGLSICSAYFYYLAFVRAIKKRMYELSSK